MICQKDEEPVIDPDDKWSVRSKDNLRTSHYEHQVAIVNGKAKILTKID
jgi:methionyl aminopeptidase